MQVPKWAGPITLDRSGRLGPRTMSVGSGHDADYFLGTGIPFLNRQVVVVYMFLELF